MNSDDVLTQTSRWLLYARRDLSGAVDAIKNCPPFYPHVCTFSQQASEKAIKACLVYVQMDFPKIHDLNRLRRMLPSECGLAHLERGLARLSQWASESRYPSVWAEPTKEDAEESLRTAQAVLKAVEAYFASRGLSI